MIDGFQVTHHATTDALAALPIWEVLVNEQTNRRVNDSRTAVVRGVNMELKPSVKHGGQNLLLNGSLHRWHNGGEANSNEFSFFGLCDAVGSLSSALGVNPKQCDLHGLEIGVNIPLDFSPLRIIKNVVRYKGEPFTRINKRCEKMGVVASLHDYEVKVYDKAKQCGEDCGNVLRIEVHINKMRFIKNYGINTLADLQNPVKVHQLKAVLFEVIEGIIWTDSSVNTNQLSQREKTDWANYRNPCFWDRLDKFKAFRERVKAVALVEKYGEIIDLKQLVSKAWDRLFDGALDGEMVALNTCLKAVEADEKTLPFHRPVEDLEAVENATFSPLECSVKRLHNTTNETNKENAIKSNTENEIVGKNCAKNAQAEKRCCKSCGRDISAQKHNSLFCSEKLFSKAAKACRNKDSNRRRNLKRIIKRAMMQNNFVAVTYQDGLGSGASYTDTLHPSELMSMPKTWFDRVVSIVILPTNRNEPSEGMEGKAAKEFLKTIGNVSD